MTSTETEINHQLEESLHLRWSRLTKTVTISDESSGLMRSSIAGDPISSNSSSTAFTAAIGSTSKESTARKNTKQKKTILSNVSGSAAPGQVVCLMGPSGSGKTTLLNCLSGRTTFDSGVMTVNGSPLTSQQKKRLMTKIAYVKQADIFFDHLTVRDQLSYTAMLRLPQSLSRQFKLKEVDRIISLLRLQKVAESEIRLVSGGEKKRVNIGTELLTDPSLILLDEPTSGLDSTSAVKLIQLLHTLATSQQKTIITSIHQPSSAVFFSFDRLLLLAEGHACYFGDPKESLQYLKQHDLSCPDGYNAADHWMDLLVHHEEASTPTSVEDMESDSDDNYNNDNGHGTNIQNYQLLIDAWDHEAVAEQIDIDCSAAVNTNNNKEESNENYVGDKGKTSKYNTNWGLQYRILVHRAMKNSRSAIFTPINLVKSLALGLIVGMLYFQMPYTEESIFDRNSL